MSGFVLWLVMVKEMPEIFVPLSVLLVCAPLLLLVAVLKSLFGRR